MLSKIYISEEKYKAIQKNKTLKNYFIKFLMILADIELLPSKVLTNDRYAIIDLDGHIKKLDDIKSNELIDIFRTVKE